MRIKKLLLGTLAIVTALSIAACGAPKTSGSASTSANDSSAVSSAATTTAAKALDEVGLKMVLLGDTPADVQKVYDKLNEKLKTDINATVSVDFLSWADWQKKYPLLLAAGDNFDLINSANWSDYFKNARNGAFLELTDDLLQKYAPQTVKNVPKEVLDSARVDGKLYNLPMNYKEVTIDGYIVRGDLMAKYNIPDIKTIDDFGNYLDAIKKNIPDMIPWDASNANNYLMRSAFAAQNGYYDLTNGQLVFVKDTESKPKVVSVLDLPGIEDYFKKMNEWKKKGYWSKNALVNKTPARDSFAAGRSAAFTDNLLQASATYTSLKASHPDWEVRFYPMCTAPLVANPFINNGVAINARSKNPERALMFLDLLKNDKWYNQLTTYGIEGEHWKQTSEGKFESLEASKNFAPDSACPWGWRDSRFYLVPQNAFSNYEPVMKNAQESAVNTNLSSFSVNKQAGNLMSIDAALSTLSTQYQGPLILGFSNDVHSDISKLANQFKTAGMDEYVKEIQKQIDEYGVTVK